MGTTQLPCTPPCTYVPGIALRRTERQKPTRGHSCRSLLWSLVVSRETRPQLWPDCQQAVPCGLPPPVLSTPGRQTQWGSLPHSAGHAPAPSCTPRHRSPEPTSPLWHTPAAKLTREPGGHPKGDRTWFLGALLAQLPARLSSAEKACVNSPWGRLLILRPWNGGNERLLPPRGSRSLLRGPHYLTTIAVLLSARHPEPHSACP